jgi:hypothetical protein
LHTPNLLKKVIIKKMIREKAAFIEGNLTSIAREVGTSAALKVTVPGGWLFYCVLSHMLI